MNAERSTKIIVGRIVAILLLTAAFTVGMWKAFGLNLVDVTLYAIRGLIFITFMVLARQELMLLFRSPGKNMGKGLTRVWAVAHTTMLEAWAGRIWLLPVLWLVISFILVFSVRPFDESERIPLYIQMLLSGQEILVMVILWVMASVSLPRERERKVIVTNASKPLSRLEMLLGKIVGFSVTTAAALAVMAIASLAILYAADYRLRVAAGEAYEIQKSDFAKTMKTPSEGLKQLSEEGSLFAHNFIDVPPDGMSIGVMAFPRDKENAPIRYIMGGTQEKVIYKFFPRLEMPDIMAFAPPGQRPYFVFQFPVTFTDPANQPSEIKIHVSASRAGPSSPQEADLTLAPPGVATWEPDRPDEIFSAFDANGDLKENRGLVTVEVTCPTPGVILQIFEAGTTPDLEDVPDTVDANVEFTFSGRLTIVDERFKPKTYFPLARPVVRGSERHDRQQVAAPKTDEIAHNRELAIYRFSGDSLRHVPVNDKGEFTLSVQLETDKGLQPGRPTVAGISVRSLDQTGAPPFLIEKEVLEKRDMRIQVPAANLGDTDPTKRGEMIVMIYCATPGHTVSLIENSVRIELPETFFFTNIIKGELVILFEAIVLITLCVACSVRLGWPVAMFCSSVCVIFGFLLDFLASLQVYGGLGAINYRSYGMNPIAFRVFDTLTGWTWSALAVMARAVPNFTLFRFPQEYLPKLLNLPWSMVGLNFLTTLGFILPVIAVGYLLFRKQELG